MKTFYHESGKGSHARKQDISNEEYRNNFDRIFGKKEKDSGCSTESEPSQEEIPVGEQ